MAGELYFNRILTGAFIFVFLVAVSALFTKAAYGRFGHGRFGPKIRPRLGWFLMELPAPLVFAYFFFKGPHALQLVPMICLFIWLC